MHLMVFKAPVQRQTNLLAELLKHIKANLIWFCILKYGICCKSLAVSVLQVLLITHWFSFCCCGQTLCVLFRPVLIHMSGQRSVGHRGILEMLDSSEITGV